MKNDDNWVVVVRRVSGAVNFTRPWKDYVAGFGDPGGNIWIGLDNLYRITHSKRHMLRVDVEDWNGIKDFAEYSYIEVYPKASAYRLDEGGYDRHSTAGDSLTVKRWWNSVHNGQPFSTYDNDNDNKFDGNCAEMYKGGWWYDGCHATNPTGQYYPHPQVAFDGITWYSVTGMHETMKFIQFRLKPT